MQDKDQDLTSRFIGDLVGDRARDLCIGDLTVIVTGHDRHSKIFIMS